jgi:A/G-specific adenine glycosylase
MTISPSIKPGAIALFQRTVWDFYRAHRRAMPWRAQPTPYYVLVSEMMLQQTQVPRVQGKFVTFVRRFPDVHALANTPLRDVLSAWSGLGYNRRAKFLHDAAQIIVKDFTGEVPHNQTDLLRLPGIGPNTAGAILAYAFNEPAVFIETNIRTAYIHHFFGDDTQAVSDEDLRQIVAASLPPENAREWYWALMDYGTHLKQTVGAQLHRVKNHRPQTRFEGSRRQVRGRVLKMLLERGRVTPENLALLIPDERLRAVCDELMHEGLIIARLGQLQLTDS